MVKNVQLFCNHISVISPEIKGLVNLRHISFYSNNISVIPPEICELQTLKKLHLATILLEKFLMKLEN